MATYQKFLIYRNNGHGDEKYDSFNIPIRPGMTVLEALFFIQDVYDPSLAFRYSCRGAICGSCGMTINKFPQLACRTQVAEIKSMKKPANIPELKWGDDSAWNEAEEILIEPLPNMKVLKDLVVDMDPFWKFYEDVKPHFVREWDDQQPESFQSPEDAKKVEHLVYCILCGICWTCPVNAKNSEYLGPAQLAKGYRFLNDSRISPEQHSNILSRVQRENGVASCENHFVCNRVCPKNVKPGTAIKKIKDI